MKVLVVDASEVFRRELFFALRKEHELHEATTRNEALALIHEVMPEAVLMELVEPQDDDHRAGVALVRELLQHPSHPHVIVTTRLQGKELGAELLNAGVLDYFTKPVAPEELAFLLRRVARIRTFEQYGPRTPKKQAEPTQNFAEAAGLNLIGADPRMTQLMQQVRRIAPTPVSVLITGETGTGKEVFAQAIHRLSDRSGKAFVPLNCAVLSETLVEDELFGHEKGAFTGAVNQRRGRFELAHDGTLFLDEIGDLSANLQAKFLRVLQEKQFERLGGQKPIHTDFRLISATHRDLTSMSREGAFREDLMFRLNVVTLHLPPLRERRGDIRPMAHHFLKEYGQVFGRGDKLRFHRDVVAYLMSHEWPGNVRELRHFVERLVALSEGDLITLEDLPEQELETPKGEVLEGHAGQYNRLVNQYRRQLVLEALELSVGHKARAAKLLGVSRSYFFKLLQQLEIETA